jgi:excisionase family DNA binding protein
VQSRQLQPLNRERPVNPTVDSGDAVPPRAQKGVLTLAEVAEELRCSKAHVSNIINQKIPHLSPLPVVRIGRRVLIRHESLMEWMKALEYKPDGVR